MTIFLSVKKATYKTFRQKNLQTTIKRKLAKINQNSILLALSTRLSVTSNLRVAYNELDKHINTFMVETADIQAYSMHPCWIKIKINTLCTYV